MTAEAYLEERAVIFEELMPTAAAMPGRARSPTPCRARGIRRRRHELEPAMFELKTTHQRDWFADLHRRSSSATIRG
jgi:hypothetical protein